MRETDDELTLRHMPAANIEAEQMVLGACLIDPGTTIAATRVRASDFYQDRHRLLFGAMQALAERGEQLDLVTVTAELMKRKGGKDGTTPQIELVGKRSYLAELVSLVPSAANFRAHETLVIEAAQLRAIDKVLGLAQAEARGIGGNGRQHPDRIVSHCISQLSDLRRSDGEEIMSYKDLLFLGFTDLEKRAELHQAGKLPGIPTGFAQLDRKLQGIQPQFYVVAGASGMGKTAFAAQLVRSAAKHLLAEWQALPEDSRPDRPGAVGVLSLEMGPGQVAIREFSSETEIPLSKLLAGRLGDPDWELLTDAGGKLRQLPVHYAFTAFNHRQIERVIDTMVQRLGVKMIVADYLQLERIEEHDGTREQEVTKISQMHKRKVAEHRVANVVISSLNRSLAARQDKRPTKADLRESGSIEYDADVILFVYRDEVYNCKCPRERDCLCGRRGKAEIIIDKGRMEGTGVVELEWVGNITTFRDRGA